MLMVTGVEIDVVEGGTRSMLVVQPPNAPGTVYRIQMDDGSAARIRGVLQVEVRRLAAQAAMEPDEDGPCRDPFNRS